MAWRADRGGACAPVGKSPSLAEPAEPRRPNTYRGGARTGRTTPGSPCGRCPGAGARRLGPQLRGRGSAPQPPAALPSPGEECATSCSPLACAAPRSEELGGRGDKGCAGDGGVRELGLGKQKVRKTSRGSGDGHGRAPRARVPGSRAVTCMVPSPDLPLG